MALLFCRAFSSTDRRSAHESSRPAEEQASTEIAVGKTLEEALNITRNDVADELDGLPPIKMHCSNLAADGLKAAIENYYENNQ